MKLQVTAHCPQILVEGQAGLLLFFVVQQDTLHLDFVGKFSG